MKNQPVIGDAAIFDQKYILDVILIHAPRVLLALFGQFVILEGNIAGAKIKKRVKLDVIGVNRRRHFIIILLVHIFQQAAQIGRGQVAAQCP